MICNLIKSPLHADPGRIIYTHKSENTFQNVPDYIWRITKGTNLGKGGGVNASDSTLRGLN